MEAKMLDRFWAKVEISDYDGCWLWTGSKDALGYGRFCVNRKPRLVHRLSYELITAPIGDGNCIDHICKNPSCVNPEHLRQCSYAENVRYAKPHHDSKTGVKGVYQLKGKESFFCRIQLNGKKITVGSFNTIEEAHLAYVEAAKRLHGSFAHIK